jgi:hypothetical protein
MLKVAGTQLFKMACSMFLPDVKNASVDDIAKNWKWSKQRTKA